jgi:ubiquinone/menaquinone biosynthesis C-methylase UbiE
LLERTRRHFLPELLECRQAMTLGDGDGRFLARLMAQNALMRAVAVDTSAAMLEQLRRNCGRSAANAEERLILVRASALETMPEAETDLIVSHFFLDCLTQAEVDMLTKSYAVKLKPETLWVVSDFALPRAAWLRPLAAVYIRTLYFAFRVLTGLRVSRLPDAQEALERAGFERVERKEFAGGLVYTELWRLGWVGLGKMEDGGCTMNVNEKVPQPHPLNDAVPDPEPAAPSLPGPDPGVFHHTPEELPEENQK